MQPGICRHRRKPDPTTLVCACVCVCMKACIQTDPENVQECVLALLSVLLFSIFKCRASDACLHICVSLHWFVFLRGSSSQWLDPAPPVSALISRARLSLIWPVVCQSPGLNWQLICMLLSSHLLFGGQELNSTQLYSISTRNTSCYFTGGPSKAAALSLHR